MQPHVACALLVGPPLLLVQLLALNAQRVPMVHSQVLLAKLAELVLSHHLSNKLNAKFAQLVLPLVLPLLLVVTLPSLLVKILATCAQSIPLLQWLAHHNAKFAQSVTSLTIPVVTPAA